MGALLGFVVLGGARRRCRRLLRLAALQRRPAGRRRAAQLPAAGDEPRLCRRRPPAGRPRHRAAHLRAVSPPSRTCVKQAFVSAEDQNFWTHRGVDPLAILRAGVTDLMHIGEGRRPIGASTITQQVAKNMLLDRPGLAGPQGPRGDPGAAHRAGADQAAHPRALSERDLSRPAVLRRRRRGAGLFQQVARPAHPGRGGVPGGAAQGAEQLQPVPLSRGGEGAARLGARPHGRGPRHHRRRRRPPPRRSRSIPAEFHRPEPIPGADWFAEEVRRELIARFGAGQHHAGRADGAHQPGSRACRPRPSARCATG